LALLSLVQDEDLKRLRGRSSYFHTTSIGFEVLLSLTNEEVREIYVIPKAVEENQLVYRAEEWELDHFDERLIDRTKIYQISKKLPKLPSQEDVSDVDKAVLLRKYSVGNELDERVHSNKQRQLLIFLAQ